VQFQTVNDIGSKRRRLSQHVSPEPLGIGGRLRPTSEKSANGRARQLDLHSPELACCELVESAEGATHGSLPSRSEKTLCCRAEHLITDAPLPFLDAILQLNYVVDV